MLLKSMQDNNLELLPSKEVLVPRILIFKRQAHPPVDMELSMC